MLLPWGYEDAIRDDLGDQYVGKKAGPAQDVVRCGSPVILPHTLRQRFPFRRACRCPVPRFNPGYTSARVFGAGKWDDGRIDYEYRAHEGTTFLETALDNLLTQDVIDKLVVPRVDPIPDLTQLHGIYVFRPEGSCSALSSALQSKLPDTPIKWVSLSDISHGTAVRAIQSHLGVPMSLVCSFVPLGVPIKTALADGRLVPAISQDRNLPFKLPGVLMSA